MENRQPPVRPASRLLSYLVCILIAGQPVFPAFAAPLPADAATKIDQAGNGVPVVNIATPNGAGISHNKYQRYNVGQEGLILNNATGQLTPTQLGGLIQNNPNLKAGQEARAIINEVTGANRSQLQGYTEVAGKTANVMVANPYGITCNGCGFINTPNVTLTTGKPVLDAAGNLQQLDVTRGSITIEGKGLDASQSDALSLIARATEVNAALHARDLTVTVGANRVDANGHATAIAGEESTPVVAVDTGALGGMYANRIRLVSSDKGVGVNLGNLTARQGDITLDAQGKLTVNHSLASGSLVARGDSVTLSGEHKTGGRLDLSAGDAVAVSHATLASDGDISLSGSGALTLNASTLTSAGSLTLNGGALTQDSASRADAGRNITATLSGRGINQGQLVAGETLTLKADSLSNTGTLSGKTALTVNSNTWSGGDKSLTTSQGAISLQADTVSADGQVIAGGNLDIQAKQLTSLAGSQLQSGATLRLNARDITLSGTLAAKNDINVTADTLKHQGKSSAAAIQLSADHLSNSGTLVAPQLTLASKTITNSGLLQGTQALNLTAERLDNPFGGSIYSAQNLTLSIPEINNAGLITTDTGLVLSGTRLTNRGEINGKNITATTSTLTNLADGVLLADETLWLKGPTLENAGHIAAKSLTVDAESVTNQGVLQGDQELSLNAKILDNGGVVLSGGTFDLQTDSLNNTGLLQAKTLNLTTGDWTNTGNALSAQDARLDVRRTLNNQGKILGQQGVVLSAAALQNRGWLAATAVTFRGDLVNSGLIQGSDSLTLEGNTLSNAAGGNLLTDGAATVQAQTLQNLGTLQAKSLSITAQDWINSGHAQAQEVLSANLTGTLTNGGTLVGNTVALHSGAVTNRGVVQGNNGLSIESLTTINARDGQLLSDGRLVLTGESATNEGLWQGKTIDFTQATLTSSGIINGRDALTGTTTGELTNSGQLKSLGTTLLQAGTLNNSGSLTGGELTLGAAVLSNDGLWQGTTGLSVTGDTLTTGSTSRTLSGGLLALDAGQLTTGGTLQGQTARITAQDWQHSGSLLGLDSVDARISGTLNNAGDLLSQDNLQLGARTLTNRGSLLSEGEMRLTGDTLENRGQLQGNTLTLSQATITNAGTIIGLQALTLEAQQVLAGRMLMAAPLLTLVNGSGGQLLTQGTLNIRGGSITNDGSWQGQRVLLSAQQLHNSGAIRSADALTLVLSGDLTSTAGSTVTAGGNAALQALNLTSHGQWRAKNLSLTGTTLTNSGDISGTDGLNITLDGTFTQQQGSTLLSAGKLTLDARTVNNLGRLQAGELAINTGALSNSGRLQGDRALTLGLTGALTNNAAGMLVSQNALTVTTPELFNYGVIQGGAGSRLGVQNTARNEGKILSGADLTVGSATLANTGWLQAGQLVLNATAAVNSGTLLADQQGTLTGSSLTNSGTVQGANLAVNYQQLTNGGTVLGSAGLNITAGQVNHQAAGKLFSGGNLILTSAGFDQAGQVVALGNLTLSLANAFSARNVLAAGNTLSVSSNGDMVNQSVLQGQAVNLSAGGVLTNNGQITTGSGSSTLSGSRIALNGAGTLQGGGDVTLTSRSDIAVNGFTGTLGSLTLNAAGSLVNTALLYAGNHLFMLANSIRNQRGDILAGNSLWMQRDMAGNANAEVVNTSGTIETQRGDITIRTANLVNQRDGLQATGNTETITNPAYVGNASFSVSLSKMDPNDYSVIRTRTQIYVGSCITGIYPGACNMNPPFFDISYKLNESRRTKRFAISRSQLEVSVNAAAGLISSGNNITLTADKLENNASNLLANQNIHMEGNQLNNQSYESGVVTEYLVYTAQSISPDSVVYKLTGRESITDSGGAVARAVIQAGGNVVANFTSDISNTNTTAYAGGNSNTLSSPSLNTLSHQSIGTGVQKQTLVNGDSVAVNTPQWSDGLQNALQQINGGSGLDTVAGNTAGLTNYATEGKGSAALQNEILAQSAANGLKQHQGSRVDTSAYPLPSGQNGYLVTSTDPKSPYLITLNPKLNGLGQLDPSLFGDLYALMGMQPGAAVRETRSTYTDQNSFLGSSYFLERLNLHPEYDYRFLGDAAFDTRYVSNTILNQTGNRYLNGIGSDLAQMQYLMDNAALAQQSLGLAFGVALTAGQIADLDHSLLWWEAATVNGQTVMIPKVYLSPKDVTVANGSVIAGNNVTLSGGTLTNSGSTMVAQNSLTLDADNSISNLNNGLLNAGGSLQLNALGDINNIGSRIAGKTVALESLDGSINNVTLTQTWNVDSGGKYGHIGITDTTVGDIASITALDSLSLNAGKDIRITGANVAAGGNLLMNAWGDIAVTANQVTDSYSQSGFRGKTATSNTVITQQGSTVTAGGNLAMKAGNDLNVGASAVNAGGDAVLIAGHDLNLNTAATGESTRRGNSESHSTDVARTTVSSGGDLTLAAGQDLNSHAAGLAAEGTVALQAGRDINLLAEETTAGSSYKAKKKVEIDESVRQQGTEIASGGNTTLIAGRDVNSEAAQVTASGDIGIGAGRDINLSTATESDYHFKEETKTKRGFLSKKTTHTIEEDRATREAGTLLSGDNVTLSAGNNLLVQGSSVVGDGDVSLSAGKKVDIVAATDTDSTYRLNETKKSGLMGTGGIGITVGSAKSRHELNEDGTTQSQSASTVGSTGGNVSISAGGQAHIGGSDLIAGKDLSITGDSVVIDPGHDKRTRDETFEQKKSGLTLALSGVVGSAINSAVTAAQSAKEESDGRLAALQATKAVLSGVQASQGAELAQVSGDPNNGMGVSLSLTTQKSSSQQHQQTDTVTGSTLNAGNTLSVVATGKDGQAHSGDIAIGGSQLRAGGDTTLNAARDILLTGAASTQQTTGKNNSSGGGVGVSIGGGSNGAGISIFANVNAAKGKDKGNGTAWTESTLDSGGTVSLSSGRDTVINGAQVNGNKVVADIGRDLLISSQQDSNDYNSKQTSVAAGGSFTFGSMTASGYINASQDKMHSTFDSVAEQSGIYAGKGGFDITVGNHTQLDGAVIASTATADKNHLDTGTLGFSDMHNEADFKTEHSGVSLSGGGSFGGDAFKGNMPGGMFAQAGSSGHAQGTTQSAIADGTITVRDRENQQQDVASLSRDTAHANDSISPIFDKEKEQKRLQTVQLISDIGGQAADIARTQGDLNGLKEAKKDHAPLKENATEQERDNYLAELRNSDSYKAEMDKFGTGSNIQRGIQAATAALQGMAGGNLAGALAGASAPELANIIGHHLGIDDNASAKAIAHAILGGAVAALQGNNAGAGAAGAAAGELAAQAIMSTLYPGRDVRQLSESEKQTLSTLASISAGMAGGIAGGDTGSAVIAT